MKLTDRARAWLLRLGIAYDEPHVIVVDGVWGDALNTGKARAALLLHVNPLAPPAPVRFPQPEPSEIQ